MRRGSSTAAISCAGFPALHVIIVVAVCIPSVGRSFFLEYLLPKIVLRLSLHLGSSEHLAMAGNSCGFQANSKNATKSPSASSLIQE